LTEETKEVVIAKANLVEHLRNIDAACDDARLSAVEKIKRIKEGSREGARMSQAPVAPTTRARYIRHHSDEG
jgi:hypothetical protein